MARMKSKSGHKRGGGRKKATSKRGRRASASTRSKARARKTANRRGARKTGRKKSGKSGRRRGTSGRTSARSTRTTARKTTRSGGQRGRKSRSSQTSGQENMSGEGGEGEESGGQVEGEGSYIASRHFRTAQTGFVQRNRSRIGRMGKEAEAALEGPEGNELRSAEEQARSHSGEGDQY